MAKPPAKPVDDAPTSERVLAYAILISIAASVISFFAVLIASANGVAREDFTEGIWPAVTWISYVGLPIGFVLILILLITNMRRRARQNQGK